MKRHETIIKDLRNKLKDIRKQAKLIGSIKSPTLKSLIVAVANNEKRKDGGKRWPDLVKAVAMNIYKKSPGAYEYMCDLFSLPGTKTVKAYCLKSESAKENESPAPVLRMRNKTKEKELSDLLFQRITRITRNSSETQRKSQKSKFIPIFIAYQLTFY